MIIDDVIPKLPDVTFQSKLSIWRFISIASQWPPPSLFLIDSINNGNFSGPAYPFNPVWYRNRRRWTVRIWFGVNNGVAQVAERKVHERKKKKIITEEWRLTDNQRCSLMNFVHYLISSWKCAEINFISYPQQPPTPNPGHNSNT